MEKKVMITIRGTQKAPHEAPQVMEFITGGVMQRYGKKLRVSYEESELIGMDGVTTTFEVEDGRVNMLRSGRLTSEMRFVPGTRTESLYALDMGTMLLGITARRVEPKLDDNGGSIYLEYGVELERTYLGLNTYDIQVRPVDEAAGKPEN